MRIAIVGGRDFVDFDLLEFKLRPYKASITLIVSGAAEGADTLAQTYAKKYDIPFQDYPANWDDLDVKPCKIKVNKLGNEYNVLAGFNRNQKIVDSADFIIAFWNSKSTGTRDTIGRANRARKDTMIIYY